MAEAEQTTQTEDSYLVLIGAERWISGWVNKGDVVLRNQIFACGPAMAARLMRQEWQHPKSGEMKPMFREATQDEIEAHLTRLDNLDPQTADTALLAEAARNEARSRGDIDAGTEKDLERAEYEEDRMQPRRRRRRKAAKED